MTALDGLDFHISRVDRDHEVVLSVKGEVDISTAPRLLEAISGVGWRGQGGAPSRE
jgi:hypothetical protein